MFLQTNELSVTDALGFIVVSLEGRGCPRRSRAWQEYKYGDEGAANEPDDHVAGIRELAETRAYMDLTRVGLSGMDANTGAVFAFLRRPDFYKAAVTQVFMRAQDGYPSMVEKIEGLSPNHYKIDHGRSLEDCAPDLKGKLLLIGGLFEGPTPIGTFRLAEALQQANKDFDMLMLPRMYTDPTSYTTRRDWDYMVRHLQGVEPPEGFKLISQFEEMVDEVALEKSISEAMDINV